MWPIMDVDLKDHNPIDPDPVNPGPGPAPGKNCVEWDKYWCGGSKWYRLYWPWKYCKKCVKWTDN